MATREQIIDALIAEAVGEGVDGMAAVAWTMRNRATEAGKPIGSVVSKSAYTGLGDPGPAARRAQKDPAVRASAAQALDAVLAGAYPDPTGGATHYWAPKGMPGGKAPYWVASEASRHGQLQIGNHIYLPKTAPAPVPPGDVPTVATQLDTAQPRTAPTPATPSLPLQSALLAEGATDHALQGALNARVNAPPMPLSRPQSDLTQPGAVQRSVQAASQSQNPALQAALSARVSGQGSSRPPMPQSYAGQDRSPSTRQAAPVPASVEDRVTARNSSLSPRPSTIGQAPTTRVVQSVPMPVGRPQSYAGQDAAPVRPAAPASMRTASPAPPSEMQRLASLYGGGGPTRPPMPGSDDRLLPSAGIPDLSAGPPIRSTNPIQIVPNSTQTAQTNSVPKDFTGQYDQYGNPVFKPSAPAAPVRVAGAPTMPMPRPTSVATQLDTKPPMPASYAPQPVQPTILGAVAPVPMPRLDRPGIFGNPQIFGHDIKLPGVLGMIQSATKAMANASGPFNNGADNLLYNTMRGGDFNTRGAATHLGTNGYLYAPKPGGGFINVGRANPAMSNAETYAARRPRNPQNAAERMESNGSRFDSGSDSIFGS